MKKIIPLLVLASTCLASCGDVSFAGSYKFMLGKQGDGETRVGVEMQLKDTASTVKEGFKELTATFELKGLAGIGGSSESSINPELVSSLVEYLPITKNDDGTTSVAGFYQVQDLKDEKYGNKVKIAFDLGDLNALFDLIELDPTDVLSHFVVSYCNGSAFTLQIPVSLDDIQMQLAWYGLYMDYDPYLKDKVNTITDLVKLVAEGKIDGSSFKFHRLTDFFDGKLPGEQDAAKRYGSHPVVEVDEKGNITRNDVYDMNEKYQGLFSNTFVYENVDGHAGSIIGSVYKEISEEENYYFFPYDSAFNTINTPIDVVLKRDVGILDYDFSEEVPSVLTVTGNKYEDGSHPFAIQYKDSAEGEWNWNSFYKKAFEFRDFHDIKVQLNKE